MRQSFWVALSLAAVLVFPSAVAQSDDPVDPPLFGLVSLARGQTAQLNVLHPPEPGLPPSPCVVVLSFVDRNGEVFTDRSGNPISRLVRLLPGEAAGLRLRDTIAFQGRDTLRMPFRAVLHPPPDDSLPPECATLVATVEIFDNLTGQTTVLYHPPEPGIPPPDDSVPR